jgi:hypothetical protein
MERAGASKAHEREREVWEPRPAGRKPSSDRVTSVVETLSAGTLVSHCLTTPAEGELW